MEQQTSISGNNQEPDLVEEILAEMSTEDKEKHSDSKSTIEQMQPINTDIQEETHYTTPINEINTDEYITYGNNSNDKDFLKEDSFYDKLIDEIREPIFVTLLFLLFGLEYTENLISKFLPFLINDNKITVLGLTFKALIAGILFFVLKKITF